MDAKSLATGCKIDEPYLVTFCCLLQYSTQIRKYKCTCRSQEQFHKVLELLSKCYELTKSNNNEA